MILVVGGTGTLGTLVTRQLLTEGARVRIMTRTPEKAGALREAGADVVQGDLLDRGSLAGACEGVSAIVAAAHSILGRGRQASPHVDGRGHRDLIDVASSGGVRQFVYTSVYDYGREFRSTPFFRIKFETEEYLKSSGIDFTIVRATAFMDFHAHVLIGQPIMDDGRVVLLGRGERPRNFVAARDVAHFIVLALRDPSLAGATLDVGGPENLTPMEVVRVYERAVGRPAKVVRVPVGIPRALSTILRPLHPGVGQILHAAVIADGHDQMFDPGSLLARFPVQLTRLEDWVAERLSASNALQQH